MKYKIITKELYHHGIMGQKWGTRDEYFNTHDHFYPSNSVYMRLDTCEPDLDRILKEHAVKPRGK